MKPTTRTICFTLVAILALAGSSAFAQTQSLRQVLIPHTATSPVVDGGATEKVAWSHTVIAGDVPWMRLMIRTAVLDGGSVLRITGLEDGAVQHLGGNQLEQWDNSSAYFNGNRVRVELIAAPGTRGNLVEIGDLLVGVQGGNPESQCGPTDDRTSSNFPERARLLNIGCTAAIYTADSCFITAGHCLSNGGSVNIVEFNVPLSDPNGTINHPGPEDQYPVDVASREFVNGGVGNDWGLFKVFPNTQTGLMPYEVQGAHVELGSSNPPVGNSVNIVGYGVDSGSDNQTQQISFGPITTSTSTTMQYQADTQGGNSGSSVGWEEGGGVIAAIHTHGGCSTGGGGSNSGTAITNAGLQAALADFCPPTGSGIPCGDIRNLQARCVSSPRGFRLQARVTLTDASHDGETLEIEVDGSPELLTVSGSRAQYRLNGAASGQHVVELTDPSGCVAPRNVICSE